jgi:DNA-binding transcriptional LysR family regulator
MVLLRLHAATDANLIASQRSSTATLARLLAEKEKHMRLRHIEVFNAIMLMGSVSAAARLINVTQPAVSRILSHAELQLGFALFERVKGRLTPTAEAQTLYPHIERLFTQLDDVQRLATNLRLGKNEGELHILSVLALSHEVLPLALKSFRVRHPQVVITVDSLHSQQVISALVLQEADIGFVFSAVAHPSLAQTHLADAPMVCIAPRGMLPAKLVKQGAVRLADLGKVPVINLDVRDPVGTSLSQACRELGVGFESIVTVQTYHAALALAHHGLGVALVDACTAASSDRGKVDVLRLEPQIAVPVKSLRATGQPNSILATAMTQCMQQAIVQTLERSGLNRIG